MHICISYALGLTEEIRMPWGSGAQHKVSPVSALEKHQLGLHQSGSLNFLLEGGLPPLCPTDKALLCACHVPCCRLKVTADRQCNLGLLWLLCYMRLSLHCSWRLKSSNRKHHLKSSVSLGRIYVLHCEVLMASL